ncbi:hypothetical protein, partial [Escherichia coli]|uniref:hypothetical protein n=1 Tax=Escherichia coli TaxID=562 RepID=UPI001BB0954A
KKKKKKKTTKKKKNQKTPKKKKISPPLNKNPTNIPPHYPPDKRGKQSFERGRSSMKAAPAFAL